MASTKDSDDSNQARTKGRPVPADHILEQLCESVAFVVDLDVAAFETTILQDSQAFFASIMPTPPKPIPEDSCDDPEPDIAPICFQRTLDHQTADNVYVTGEAAAAAALKTAIAGWKMAIGTYRFTTAGAAATMQAAITAARNTYDPKLNHDSPSRLCNLYFELKTAVAAAVVAYDGTVAGAGSTLAGAAGTLLAAYATFAAAIETASDTLVDQQATADQTFWQAVEAIRTAA